MGAFLDKPKTEKFNDSGSAAHGTLSAVEQTSLSKTTIEAKIPVENLTLDKRHIDLIVA
uniref:Uncharacterized protein n=1 Tax=Romanomermis culicivorax TaxID=13658 RepID=A0A915J466_ROMCU